MNKNKPSSVPFRIYRGGCWFYFSLYTRVAFHSSFSPTVCTYDLGFRLVKCSSALELIMEKL